MNNIEKFEYLMLKKQYLEAAEHAAYVAAGKASRSGRSSWLESVRDALQEGGLWDASYQSAIEWADSYGDWRRLDAVLAALKSEKSELKHEIPDEILKAIEIVLKRTPFGVRRVAREDDGIAVVGEIIVLLNE